jgi:hypothetical protein
MKNFCSVSHAAAWWRALSVGTVLNVHGTGDYPDFRYQGIVIQGIAGVLTIRFYESVSHHTCDSHVSS